MAAVGFLVGVVWPRLAGFQLVPAAPVDQGDALGVAKEVAPAVSAQVPAAKLPIAKAHSAATAIKKGAESERVAVQGAEVTSCRDKDGSTVKDCGKIDFDSVALPKIKALGNCDGTAEARGTLSLGFEIDFDAGKVVRIVRGKSTTVPSAFAKRLAACVEKEFESVTLDRVEHAYSSYTVFYKVEFREPGASVPGSGNDPSGGDEPVAASGRATVGWQVALIRAEPEDGEIVARLLSGTTVVVTARQGDWYKVKYGAKGEVGWVFKSAIGL